jgi:predicted AlkP superfamily pyrophosphatase or phosphodiesterase
MKRILASLAALALAACAATTTSPPADAPPPAPIEGRSSGGINAPAHRDGPYVVLVSFDGFRPAYLERFALPNFRRAMARGARARSMTPVFPSLTFPNHYSLVTGLHPGRHGIVANSFYDPALNRTYSLSDRSAVSDPVWYRGEPIWVTAERQGMVSACFFWPGSEAPIAGVHPTHWKAYDASIPNDERIRTVLDWLRLPAERRPHLITLYFSELDSASHRAPLDSPEVERAAQSLDRTLGLLLDGVDALPVRDRVYLVLTSDHGMVETSAAQTVRLDALVDLSTVRVGFSGPVTSLHVGGDAIRARDLRNRLNAGLQHGRAWLREELPERYHYRTDRRAGDVVVVMDEAWRLIPGADIRPSRAPFGMHGWDPALPSMQAIFLLIGPDITPDLVVPPVNNVDVYPLLTELLGLTPATGIDGRAGAISGLVRTDGVRVR